MAANRSRAGRPPKPESATVIRHPSSKKREPKDAAPPVGLRVKPGIPTRPAFLGKTGREEWARVVKLLAPRKVLTTADYAALAAYCDAWETLVLASRAIQEKGLTFETESGYEQQRPEVSIRHQARKQVVDFAREYGLTPSSRAKVSGPSEAKNAGDEWDGF